MSGNLFTDVYDVQKMFFGKDAESRETMEICRKEIFDVIEKNQIPQKLKYLMFKMTNRCNSNCEYCSHAIHSKIHVTSVLTRQNMDETPEFIRRMSDMGISVQLSP